MATHVNKSSMVSQTWQNVKDLLDNRNNVRDPISGTAHNRKFVYTREPDVKSIAYDNFPYIIIHPVTYTSGTEQTGNGQIQTIRWTCEIEVVTSDIAANNRSGKGATDNDAIADDIIETLNSQTNRNTLRANGLRFARPNVTDVIDEEFKDTIIYRRTFILEFSSKKKIF